MPDDSEGAGPDPVATRSTTRPGRDDHELGAPDAADKRQHRRPRRPRRHRAHLQAATGAGAGPQSHLGTHERSSPLTRRCRSKWHIVQRLLARAAVVCLQETHGDDFSSAAVAERRPMLATPASADRPRQVAYSPMCGTTWPSTRARQTSRPARPPTPRRHAALSTCTTTTSAPATSAKYAGICAASSASTTRSRPFSSVTSTSVRRTVLRYTHLHQAPPTSTETVASACVGGRSCRT